MGYLATIVGRLEGGAAPVRPRLPTRFEPAAPALSGSHSDTVADADVPPREPPAFTGPAAESREAEPAIGTLHDIRRRAAPGPTPWGERPSQGAFRGPAHPRDEPGRAPGALDPVAPVPGPALPGAGRAIQPAASATPSAQRTGRSLTSTPSPAEPREPPASDAPGQWAEWNRRNPRAPGPRTASRPPELEARGGSSEAAARLDPARAPSPSGRDPVATIVHQPTLRPAPRATTDREPPPRPALLLDAHAHPRADQSPASAAPEPTIEVTIGRIEVRAAPAPPRAGPAAPPAASAMTLEQYLRSRAGGAGR
jgi:hypothetical protein